MLSCLLGLSHNMRPQSHRHLSLEQRKRQTQFQKMNKPMQDIDRENFVISLFTESSISSCADSNIFNEKKKWWRNAYLEFMDVTNTVLLIRSPGSFLGKWPTGSCTSRKPVCSCFFLISTNYCYIYLTNPYIFYWQVVSKREVLEVYSTLCMIFLQCFETVTAHSCLFSSCKTLRNHHLWLQKVHIQKVHFVLLGK